MPPIPSRPTYCEIDLSAIAHNVRQIRRIVGEGVRIMAVVKANAYGHGAVEVARAALGAGAEWLGVAFAAEGLALRRSGIAAPILVLGWAPEADAEAAIANDLTLTLYDLDLARACSAIARRIGKKARAHVKVDTGMGRLGLPPDDAPLFIRAIQGFTGLAVEGVFTHFSASDMADRSHTLSQLAKFSAVLDTLALVNMSLPLAHAANSAAAFAFPESHFDMVRMGIAMYGLHPSDDVPCPPGFLPALAWKSRVAQTKTLPPGHPVSYGNEYVTHGRERIAVVPVGYADGYRRLPRNVNEVLVGGRRAPVVGRVCMDQIMVNVTDAPGVKMGDEVVLIGRQGEAAITAEDLARRWGTINYDVAAGIMARVPRVYVG